MDVFCDACLRFLKADNRFDAEMVVLDVFGFAVRKVVPALFVLKLPPNVLNLEVDLVEGVVDWVDGVISRVVAELGEKDVFVLDVCFLAKSLNDFFFC